MLADASYFYIFFTYIKLTYNVYYIILYYMLDIHKHKHMDKYMCDMCGWVALRTRLHVQPGTRLKRGSRSV